MAQTSLSSTRFRMAALCSASLLLILILHSGALGQGSTPQRGFQPGASYALSDIETINTTNGNLSLHLPLGRLAAGRGGFSGQLNLHYDSKLYDSKTQYYQDWDHVVLGQPHVAIRNMLVTSDQGGWHYGTGYELQLIDRMTQYPPEIAPQYPDTQTIRHYKVKVAFPDGSVREFLPRSFGSPMEEGYYDIRPDGWQTRFNGSFVEDVPYLTNTLTYYTFDGTYIRLEVEHDSDGNWWNNPWTLYFPDGTKVTNFGSRISDRNGNYVEFSNITYNGHPATQLMDQLGRKIILEAANDADLIRVPGVGGELVYEIHWKAIQVYKTYSTVSDDHYSPEGYPDVLGLQFVVSEIELPAETGGLKYLFGYNAVDSGTTPCCSPSYGWGELNSVTTPTGAQAQYQYQLDGQNGPGFGYTWDAVLRNQITQKTLTYQQQYDGSSTPVTETWTYNSMNSTIVNPDGGTITQFNDAQRNYRTQQPDGTVSEKLWQANRPQGFPATGAYDQYTNIDAYDPQRANSYVKTEFTSIRDAGGSLSKTAIKDYSYDKNGNVTRVAEYDWVDYGSVSRGAFDLPTAIPASAVLKRVTTNTFAHSTPDAADSSSNDADSYWNATSPNLRNAVASSEVSNGSATLTRTEFSYDNAATTGNLTQQKSWDSTKGAYSNPLSGANSISVSHQYDSYGNPTLSTDARGYQTELVYGSINGFTNLYPTQVKSAYQTSVQRTETREYDFSTGAVTRVTDVDNNVSSSTTYDIFGRPTLVKAAEGKPEETRTSTVYSDVNRRVIVKSDLNTLGDEKLVTIQHYDQLGRVRLVRQLEDATTQSATDETTGIKVQTRYQISGNFSYVLSSNPYRPVTSGAASSEATIGWTRSKTNNSGQVIEVQTFAGATAPAPWGTNSTSTGTVTTAYDANFTTVTDPAGRVRRSMIDGLGSLIRVDEPDASSSLGSTTSPNQPTHYAYDVLGNLTQVTQSDGTTTQQRSFIYSSLSRLTQATNSESGTISYQYDESGNLVVKTDARAVSTHYSYDALNRLTRRWYNAESLVSATVHNQPALSSSVGVTSEVKFYYDLQSLPTGAPDYVQGAAIGRLVAQTYGTGSNGDYFAYDNLGRATLKYQQTGTINYRVNATYNLAGAVATMTYPSDHSITNSFDQAGRLTTFTGNLGSGGTSRPYSSGILYSPAGAMVKEQLGTNSAIYNKLFYNSRCQLAEIRASTSYTGPTDMDANRGGLVNHYSSASSMSDNNGNLRKQEILIPEQTTRVQHYDYDSLNRLTSVIESISGTDQWKQEFEYDRWGNRTIKNTTSDGINKKQFTVNKTNNRLGVPVGQSGVMEYDAAGNLKNDTYTGAGNRTYDGENKITSAWGGNNQAQLYSYDASGQRIKRTVDGVETWQVYGLGGELLAEYPVNGAATSPQKECGYRNGQLLVTAEASTAVPVNVALASNSASATASSTYSGFAASGAINGDRKGLFEWQNGYWSTASSGFPAWLEVQFNGSKTISEIDIITIQNNHTAPVEPTAAMTFSSYGLTNYEVQYWTGSAWTTISGGTVTGNNKVWRKFTFTPLTTTKIRVLASASPDNYSRLAEVEAWTGPSPAPRYNLALGATATASSNYAGWPASSTINGDRKSLNAGTDGGWVDAAPANSFPDWLQVDFGTNKTIDEIDVFTLQDNYAGSAEPTESMTFTQWGLSGYEVQYWNGSSWITVPNGSVSGNNKIWRKFTFSPISTSKIRVLTNASVDGYSRLTEVEAYGPADTGGSGGIHWLVSDHLGTPRMIFDQTGDLENMSRHDYLPFGEELFAPTSGRTTAQGYTGGDGIRQQFTSKERDIETGLDYFLARYYSSQQGRFNSIDPAGGDPLKPQSFNKYQYAQSNPLRNVDSTGTYEEDVHRDLTTVLAYAVGFTWDEAIQIGNENQKVDEDERDPVQIDLTGPGFEARRDFHFTTAARRNKLWQQFEASANGMDPGLKEYRWSTQAQAFYALGTYLHAAQDSFSHAGYGPILGHALAGHGPDKTYRDVLKANIMARDTYDALGRALNAFRFRSLNHVRWSKIRPYVQRFNKARTGEEKKKILGELRAFIESERFKGTLKGRFGCIAGEGYPAP